MSAWPNCSHRYVLCSSFVICGTLTHLTSLYLHYLLPFRYPMSSPSWRRTCRRSWSAANDYIIWTTGLRHCTRRHRSSSTLLVEWSASCGGRMSSGWSSSPAWLPSSFCSSISVSVSDFPLLTRVFLLVVLNICGFATEFIFYWSVVFYAALLWVVFRPLCLI